MIDETLLLDTYNLPASSKFTFFLVVNQNKICINLYFLLDLREEHLTPQKKSVTSKEIIFEFFLDGIVLLYLQIVMKINNGTEYVIDFLNYLSRAHGL